MTTLAEELKQGLTELNPKPSRFDYVRYDEQSANLQKKFKGACEALEDIAAGLPDSRAKSLFLTALEEAYMWTGKAIRDWQISRGGPAADEPRRTDE